MHANAPAHAHAAITAINTATTTTTTPRSASSFHPAYPRRLASMLLAPLLEAMQLLLEWAKAALDWLLQLAWPASTIVLEGGRRYVRLCLSTAHIQF